jgi:hypothetical protein
MNARLQVPMSPTLVRVASLTIAIVASGPEIGRAQERVASRPEGTYWKAIELAGSQRPRRILSVRPICGFRRETACPAQTAVTGSRAAIN